MTVKTKELQFAERVQHVPQSFIREILKVTSNPDVVSFAGGLPNPAFFPVNEIALCAERVLRSKGEKILQYSSTEGLNILREFIAERYLRHFGFEVSPEQILITNGSQQALDLIGKVFLNKADKVLLERPTYLGALQCLSMYQPQFQEVTLLEDGIDIEELDVRLSADPKLFYCIPNFQNPTGLQYSVEKRRAVAELVSQTSTIIIEDDPYGDIRFTDQHPAPIFSLLPEQTILLGSFSKAIAPGIRLGWMVASPEIIRKATIMKQASDLHTSNLPQYILWEYLQNNDLEKHLIEICLAYSQQKDVMMECLNNFFPSGISYTKPQGGMFTWVTLPEGITARQLLTRSLEGNVIFVPGDAFYAAKPDWQTLRLNFSNVPASVMREAMFKLGKILKSF